MATDMMVIYKTVGLGAAAAVAISATVIGAAYAVGRICSAALGAAAEKPELLTRSLLFVALAEGLAVLGFAFAMMLLQKI
jgi:V/A-type H+-transporting ATPase subunit K